MENVLEHYDVLPKDIYGKGYAIKCYRNIREDGLQQILPLEEYDKILIGLSGGKDSVSALLYLLDLGVPKDKIILLHHAIDGAGNNPILEMDWPCTKDYCIKLAELLGITLKFSWREEGFAGEILRLGASKPVSFEELDSDKVKTVHTKYWQETIELKKELTKAKSINDHEKEEEILTRLKELGNKFMFPAKEASLKRRWCSSILKIEVCNRMLRYAEEIATNSKILFIDGIRREESNSRSMYNEIEVHNSTALVRCKRLVHHWRPIIEWTSEMVWEIIKKYNINPHPCYKLGWNRCSCACCIFSLPKHFRGVKEILPEQFDKLVELENRLGFTVDNHYDLLSYIKLKPEDGTCVVNKDEYYIKCARSKVLPDNYFSYEEDWELPPCALEGAEGGPC